MILDLYHIFAHVYITCVQKQLAMISKRLLALRNYVLSMKFAAVKNELILEMSTPYACVREDTPYAPLSGAEKPTLETVLD